MKNLRLDLYETAEHAQKVMADLGISYQHATPQSIVDSWWFWNCENVPDPLPPGLSELKAKPHECIGYGLSAADADKIVSGAGQVLPIGAWNARVTRKKHQRPTES